MFTRTVVWCVNKNNEANKPRFLEMKITDVSINECIKKAKSLAVPEGYHFLGTRNGNNWD